MEKKTQKKNEETKESFAHVEDNATFSTPPPGRLTNVTTVDDLKKDKDE